MSPAPRGSGIVSERVECFVAEALRGAPERWWDLNELVEAVLERAPGLSADPSAHVATLLRRWRRDGAVAWRRERRPSARTRYMGQGRGEREVFVYRLEETDEEG